MDENEAAEALLKAQLLEAQTANQVELIDQKLTVLKKHS